MIRLGLVTGALFSAATTAFAQSPLPFTVGGAYALTDQRGNARTQADPNGFPQLLFFGYANCPGICSAAMPLMGDVTTSLAKEGIKISPVMITIDPARDRVETMAEPLAKFHPDFVGLTGDQPALDTAYKAFSIEHELAYVDPDYGPVYSHGSLIYLMDASGEVLTLIPPVMDATRAAQVALTYLK